MARIRSIHPGFFTDERLVSVSLPARLLFLGLGVEADDKGIFEWKPLTIKMRVFPADNVDVAELLSELEEANAIASYEVDGRKYGAIRNFRRFQRPKTPNDVHPITDEFRNYVGLTQPISETFPQKGEKSQQMEDGGGKRKEEKGGEKNEVKGKRETNVSPKKSGSRLPIDWFPSQPDIDFAKQEGLSEHSINIEAAKFRDYWHAKTGQGASKLDWSATWRNWVRNAPKRHPSTSQVKQPSNLDRFKEAIRLAEEQERGHTNSSTDRPPVGQLRVVSG